MLLSIYVSRIFSFNVMTLTKVVKIGSTMSILGLNVVQRCPFQCDYADYRFSR